MAEPQPSKLVMRVRFRSPAPRGLHILSVPMFMSFARSMGPGGCHDLGTTLGSLCHLGAGDAVRQDPHRPARRPSRRLDHRSGRRGGMKTKTSGAPAAGRATAGRRNLESEGGFLPVIIRLRRVYQPEWHHHLVNADEHGLIVLRTRLSIRFISDSRVSIHAVRAAWRTGHAWAVGGSRSVPAGEAFGCDAELVTLRVLHHGPALARHLVIANDRGAKPHEFVDG